MDDKTLHSGISLQKCKIILLTANYFAIIAPKRQIDGLIQQAKATSRYGRKESADSTI